jgi:hypothetical protein
MVPNFKGQTLLVRPLKMGPIASPEISQGSLALEDGTDI